MAVAAATVAAYAAVTAAAAGTYAASEGHKGRTSAGHARKRANLARTQAAEKSAAETRESELIAKRDKRTRARNVQANRTIFSDPLGTSGRATAIKQNLGN